MPYIHEELRPDIDEAVEQLALTICAASPAKDGEACFGGPLNYAITSLIATVIAKRGGLRYWIIALVLGVLHNVQTEFYRRVVASYEDDACNRNGDVYAFEELKGRRGS